MGSGRLCCISFLFKKWGEGERERERERDRDRDRKTETETEKRGKTVMQLDDMTDREKIMTGRQGERENSESEN